MKASIISLLTVGLLSFGIYQKGCNYKEVDDIKNHATNTFSQAGFVVTGYEGYTIGDMFQTPGGEVWYQIVRTNDNKVLYNCFLSKWGTEYHIYNMVALNAIKAGDK